MLITLSLPLLITALIIGFVISLFQAVSSVQEQTLSSVPKMIGVFSVIMILGPWFLSRMLEFMTYIFTNIPTFMIR
ncbi:MAG: flagellar type III secretion system protein FliQ [Candidatus Sericytochromatia bacterium]|nr:flagellar type III secretion system protein FliQ [Candidatus Sericytochromatia bacterium]